MKATIDEVNDFEFFSVDLLMKRLVERLPGVRLSIAKNKTWRAFRVVEQAWGIEVMVPYEKVLAGGLHDPEYLDALAAELRIEPASVKGPFG